MDRAEGGEARSKLARKGCSKLGPCILRLTQVTSLEANPSAVLWNGKPQIYFPTRRDWLSPRDTITIPVSISLFPFRKFPKALLIFLLILRGVVQFIFFTTRRTIFGNANNKFDQFFFFFWKRERQSKRINCDRFCAIVNFFRTNFEESYEVLYA